VTDELFAVFNLSKSKHEEDLYAFENRFSLPATALFWGRDSILFTVPFRHMDAYFEFVLCLLRVALWKSLLFSVNALLTGRLFFSLLSLSRLAECGADPIVDDPGSSGDLLELVNPGDGVLVLNRS